MLADILTAYPQLQAGAPLSSVPSSGLSSFPPDIAVQALREGLLGEELLQLRKQVRVIISCDLYFNHHVALWISLSAVRDACS